jgi:hypothetical protein
MANPTDKMPRVNIEEWATGPRPPRPDRRPIGPLDREADDARAQIEAEVGRVVLAKAGIQLTPQAMSALADEITVAVTAQLPPTFGPKDIVVTSDEQGAISVDLSPKLVAGLDGHEPGDDET